MTANDVVAQIEATQVYRAAEVRLRRDAKVALLSGARSDAQELLALAHQVGMEFVRNRMGADPDRWERDESLPTIDPLDNGRNDR